MLGVGGEVSRAQALTGTSPAPPPRPLDLFIPYGCLIFFLAVLLAWGILVPQPGVKPTPLLWQLSLTLWTTREVLALWFLSSSVVSWPLSILSAGIFSSCVSVLDVAPVPPSLSLGPGILKGCAPSLTLRRAGRAVKDCCPCQALQGLDEKVTLFLLNAVVTVSFSDLLAQHYSAKKAF